MFFKDTSVRSVAVFVEPNPWLLHYRMANTNMSMVPIQLISAFQPTSCSVTDLLIDCKLNAIHCSHIEDEIEIQRFILLHYASSFSPYLLHPFVAMKLVCMED